MLSSKIRAVLILITWIIGITWMLIAMTDFFTENLFQKQYVLIYWFIIISSSTVISVAVNYYKRNRNTGKE
jgi:hypothetical protein